MSERDEEVNLTLFSSRSRVKNRLPPHLYSPPAHPPSPPRPLLLFPHLWRVELQDPVHIRDIQAPCGKIGTEQAACREGVERVAGGEVQAACREGGERVAGGGGAGSLQGARCVWGGRGGGMGGRDGGGAA